MSSSYTEICLYAPTHQPGSLYNAVVRYLRQLAPLGNYIVQRYTDEAELINTVADRLHAGVRVLVLGGPAQLSTALLTCMPYQPLTVAQINGFLFEPSTTENSLWLTELWSQTPHLFDYVHIGLKAHLTPAEDLTLLRDLHFETLRYGALLDNIGQAEPLLRQSQVLILRPLSVAGITQVNDWQQELPPAWQDPVGLTVQQLAQLLAWAGTSGQSQLLHLPYPYIPAEIIAPKAPSMLATALWYWLEAGNHPLPRPTGDELAQMLHHPVTLARDYTLHFYEHIPSGRWYMDLEDEPGSDLRFIMPCSEDDFRQAVNQEPPTRYLRLSHRRSEYLRNIDL